MLVPLLHGIISVLNFHTSDGEFVKRTAVEVMPNFNQNNSKLQSPIA
jgi:hypothetical protein